MSLQSILDVLPFEVVVAANHHPEVLINRAARRSGGLPETGPITLDQLNRVLESQVVNLSHDETGPALQRREWPLEIALQGQAIDAELLVAAGGPRPAVRQVAVHGRPLIHDGGVVGAVVTLEDTSELHRANRRLRRHNEQLTAIARAVRAILRGQDGRGAITEAARAVSGAAGTSLFEPSGPDELVCTASSGGDLVGMRVPLSRRSILAEAYDTGRSIWVDQNHADPRCDHQLHSVVTERLGVPVTSGSWTPVVDAGRCLGVLIASFAGDQVVRDEAEGALSLLADEAALALAHERLVLELERLSSSDPLTGAVNRRSWDGAINRELPRAAREARPVSVLMVDFDHFKDYNDSHGHSAGDVLLRDAVRAWSDRLRPTDVLCRWGGDEFAVLLPGCGLADAASVAEELRDMVLVDTSCSVGAAEWDGVETGTALLQRADTLLYQAKSNGRDRVIGAGRPPL